MINMTAEEGNQETAEEKKKRLAAEKRAKADANKAAKQAAKEAEEKEKQKQKAEKEAAKNKKQSTLAGLAEDYDLKKITGIFIPAYFHRKKRYANYNDEKVDMYHADNFLFGMEIFAEQGSCSAKITYVGPNRKYTLNNTRIAKREARPSQNNWKCFVAPLRLFKNTEHTSKVKDPKIIRDLLTSRGGIANFKIRFVQDKEFTKADVKKKVYHKDPVRLKGIPYRIKRDQAKLGIKPVLRDKDEAQLLLKDLQKAKDKRASHVIGFLQDEIKKYTQIEQKELAESKKD